MISLIESTVFAYEVDQIFHSQVERFIKIEVPFLKDPATIPPKKPSWVSINQHLVGCRWACKNVPVMGMKSVPPGD